MSADRNATGGRCRPRRNPVSVGILGIAAILMGLALTGATSVAQEGLPPGVTCEEFAVDSAPTVYVPGAHDLVVIVLDNGSEYRYTDVVPNQRIDSPTAASIVRLFKCDGVIEPTPTPEPTPVTTATPGPTPEPTPEPTPGTTATPGPTPEPTPTPDDTTTIVVPPTEPTPEVQSKVVTRTELATTGSESVWLFVLGATLVGGGAMIVGTGLSARRRLDGSD